MSQSHNTKKDSKKTPAKTLKEKQAAKRDKKNPTGDSGVISQIKGK
jgi:hypothetical protein